MIRISWYKLNPNIYHNLYLPLSLIITQFYKCVLIFANLRDIDFTQTVKVDSQII